MFPFFVTAPGFSTLVYSVFNHNHQMDRAKACTARAVNESPSALVSEGAEAFINSAWPCHCGQSDWVPGLI